MTESEVARGLVRGNVIQACARGLLRGLLRGLVHDNVIQGCARDLVQQPTVTAMVETRGRAHTVADPEAEMIAERERHIGKVATVHTTLSTILHLISTLHTHRFTARSPAVRIVKVLIIFLRLLALRTILLTVVA